MSKVYNAGAELAAQDVYEVDPSVTCITARDFLLYCYYCGLIHIGARRCRCGVVQFTSHPSRRVNSCLLPCHAPAQGGAWP